MNRKTAPTTAGAGQIRFSGYEGPANYVIEGEPSKLRLGPTRLRGALKVSAEVAQAAFRAGDGALKLDDGRSLRISMIGHTAGSEDVFVELRV
ncbi:hypothetical protein [Phenylobacterium sp.]|uniref:hypothetical protein n=1 Tax=Phenylobacterium sp. TaxID=1871053 RepID=UPI0025E0B343|nr:hypothetical protein [Phenylobacterium sp.]